MCHQRAMQGSYDGLRANAFDVDFSAMTETKKQLTEVFFVSLMQHRAVKQGAKV